MWRLLFCKHKLNYQEVVELSEVLDDISYACGVSLSHLGECLRTRAQVHGEALLLMWVRTNMHEICIRRGTV